MAQADKILFSTDREIKNLKAGEKRYTAKDAVANGLFLDITTTGVKSWWYRYSLNGKQERLVIGRYPDLSLKDARQVRDESASLVAKGISPKQSKKKVTSVLFSDYGERYLNEVIKKERKDPYNMILCLNNDIYPMIGHIALDQINVDDVRRVIWRKKDQGYDAAANQVRGLLKRMFDYAMTLGLAPYNPVLAIPTRHIFKAVPRNRYLSTSEIRTYYTTLLNSRIYRPRKLGLLLSLLTLVRKSELLRAKWEHIDFEQRIWLIPETKADSTTGHSREMVVYMSDQVIEIFKDLKTIAGDEPYVFVGRKSGTHISHNAFNTAQKSALALTDIPDFTVHDLRRTASTHLNEQGFNSDAIEACLNHTMRGVRGIYNKAKYEKERIDMMQKWSDYIFNVIYEQNLIFFNEAKSNKAVLFVNNCK
ncbi:tyrosine-type recombinase/integrase [Acinetobacter baumannii]|uniref:tyrosine-type recombinase/integrase n=1 Tax=Acinetobacter baumannii TaxID=470 RepID=UPI0024DEA6AB|nr:tyrosine-type recombinase/integrase [Acinetobacter baumannii]MDK2108349.1 tyrosine-type recombinase/integrase [Acinetobacter baumannii]MDK2113704.1 tyrosine-type recombinase/integrase [Acinetobacter baumannii]MDK2143215.1 tyrosine-type recombinase/integrase [Acinetobacter baumannii]MDK2154085.1 tyrosine-type recombinase/integrase [Acinetobacter baumannii]MDK2157844.1 tyrosine-type recombinase/integrase [Acinetobacter baumannii]